MDSTEWDARYSESELIWSAEPNIFVKDTLQDSKPGTVLDVGCGEGRNALWLASIGWDATGIDFSKIAVDKANALARSKGLGAKFEVSDLMAYQPQENSFDAVIVCYIHLDCESMINVWQKAFQALAPTGLLLIIGHDLDNLERGFGGPQDRSVLFEPNDVLEALPTAKVIRSEKAIREVTDGEGNIQQAIDALVILSKE